MGGKKKKSPNRWKITLNSGRWLQTLGWKCGNVFWGFFFYTAGRQRRYAALAGLLNFQSWNCLVVGPRAASYLETLRIRSWLTVFVSFFTLLWFCSGKKLCHRKKNNFVTLTTKWGKRGHKFTPTAQRIVTGREPVEALALHCVGEKLTRASPVVPPTSRAGYDLNLSSLTKSKDCTTHPLRTPPPPGAPAPHPSLLGIFRRNEMEMWHSLVGFLPGPV